MALVCILVVKMNVKKASLPISQQPKIIGSKISMSVSVSIIEQVESTDDLPELLRHIATQIEGGISSSGRLLAGLVVRKLDQGVVFIRC